VWDEVWAGDALRLGECVSAENADSDRRMRELLGMDTAGDDRDMRVRVVPVFKLFCCRSKESEKRKSFAEHESSAPARSHDQSLWGRQESDMMLSNQARELETLLISVSQRPGAWACFAEAGRRSPLGFADEPEATERPEIVSFYLN
jgi:hypothetical protein